MRRTNTAVWVEGAKRWQINVQKDGVRKTFVCTKPGKEGQREANRKADEWLDKGISTSRIKVSDAWNHYLEQKRLLSNEDSRKAESFGRNYLLPEIGKRTVSSLSEQDFQSIINKAFKNPHGKTKDPLSRKTLHTFCSYIRQFVKFCRKSKWSSLFLEDLTVPNSARYKGKDVLSVESVKKVFNIDTTIIRNKRVKDDYVNYYRFQLLTGVRPGEMRAIKWIDVSGDVCSIKGSINVSGEKTSGKNENSLRSITLSPAAISVIEEQRKTSGESEYIFPMASMHTYYGRWKKYQESNDIPPISLYEMRHTFVSMAKILPEGQLKQIVGHSRNMDTYGVYSHYLDGEGKEIAQSLQEIFETILK